MEAKTLIKIKHGQKIDKPVLKVRTVKPSFWDPNSNSAYAEAATAWRIGLPINDLKNG